MSHTTEHIVWHAADRVILLAFKGRGITVRIDTQGSYVPAWTVTGPKGEILMQKEWVNGRTWFDLANNLKWFLPKLQ